MGRKERLCKAIKKIGWGYFMLYFDLNLGTIDIFPSWLGYMFYHEGIRDGIAEEEETAKLLRPIGIILGVYYGITWLLTIFSIPTDLFVVKEIVFVLSLYYHFQLMTNLAHIAKKYKCPQEKGLLHLRTAETILLTILAFTTQFEKLYGLSIILIVFQIIVMICLCVELRSFKHAIENLESID